MFKGTFEHRIDAKGRLPVPAPFRRLIEHMDPSGVVAARLDECLAVYPRNEWLKLESQLVLLPQLNRQSQAVVRRLASQAADCELDSQGRILIPPVLRRAAGLQEDVVVVGVLNRFEVWPPSAWAGFLKASEGLLDGITLPTSTAKV